MEARLRQYGGEKSLNTENILKFLFTWNSDFESIISVLSLIPNAFV